MRARYHTLSHYNHEVNICERIVRRDKFGSLFAGVFSECRVRIIFVSDKARTCYPMTAAVRYPRTTALRVEKKFSALSVAF